MNPGSSVEPGLEATACPPGTALCRPPAHTSPPASRRNLPRRLLPLCAQGLPYSINGVGDLLALFRCISCKYKFATDASKPQQMGAVGRVYASGEPEMSHHIQRYDKQVYLRVAEAQVRSGCGGVTVLCTCASEAGSVDAHVIASRCCTALLAPAGP